MEIKPEDIWPDCAVCGKPVEKMVCWTSIEGDAAVVEVTCHGETEKTTVDYQIIANTLGVEHGLAFVPQPLLPAPEEK